MPSLVIALVALALAVAALALAVAVTRRIGARDPVAVPPFWRKALRIRPIAGADPGEVAARPDRRERVAFVANPTKPGIAELREQAMRACAIRYLPEPLWFHTTAEDPGTGQARAALDAGADLVVAIGGDGTVRAVAEALAGSDRPLGIVPVGTGNLFARNLDLPLDEPAALLRTALEGSERRADVGWLEMLSTPDGAREGERHVFLVTAGTGLDAEMVAGADDQLKRRLGWAAYFFAAFRHLGKHMEATIAVDGGEPAVSRMRTVLMANVGRLPAGLRLIPDASLDDGWLDVAAIDARGGVVGWTELFGVVVAQGAGIREPWPLRTFKTSRIDHARGRVIDISMRDPQRVQVDGESLGRASHLRASVDAGALLLRVPAGTVPRP